MSDTGITREALEAAEAIDRLTSALVAGRIPDAIEIDVATLAAYTLAEHTAREEAEAASKSAFAALAAIIAARAVEGTALAKP